MAHPLPNTNGDGRPDDRDHDGPASEPAPVPLFQRLAEVGRGQGSRSGTQITVSLDEAEYEALIRKARAEGVRLGDVVRTAVQREIGNRSQVIALILRWNLNREDLDHAAETLGVDRISDLEWEQVGVPTRRRSRP
ncbi:hypothetical protein Misp01_49140 [Microtetraspora sp. NBRC 13810]|uniref:hypothetical protein n=1 Tax=Microtetraspora sp. NBRC 13810 TaxID=3030990 RepID=UPI0024A3AA5E|nr:hypothetical protein [Microtetraspora sp. NBRC 13810]GLW09785.1 hypothetical protein Misp01_49140 [Microtetraspora sp. NBRC 13810]